MICLRLGLVVGFMVALGCLTSAQATATVSNAEVPGRTCCKMCDKGFACGNTCIARQLSCSAESGCACNVDKCCKVCKKGVSKPCGDTCIPLDHTCHIAGTSAIEEGIAWLLSPSGKTKQKRGCACGVFDDKEVSIWEKWQANPVPRPRGDKPRRHSKRKSKGKGKKDAKERTRRNKDAGKRQQTKKQGKAKPTSGAKTEL